MNKLDSLLPSFKPKIEVLLHELELMGIKCVVTCGRRTMKEQHNIYEQGRSLPGKVVSMARPGQSPHQFGAAVDVVPLDSDGQCWWNAPDDVWHAIAEIVTKNGLVSGYNFKSFRDAPHIEDPHWKEQQALWNAGKINVA